VVGCGLTTGPLQKLPLGVLPGFRLVLSVAKRQGTLIGHLAGSGIHKLKGAPE